MHLKVLIRCKVNYKKNGTLSQNEKGSALVDLSVLISNFLSQKF